MKKTFTILILTAFLSLNYFNANAKVWRLNNSGANADFNNWDAAYNAANANDTIYVESTPTSYGYAIMHKPLVLIGTGYFLQENLPTQFKNIWNSTFLHIDFNVGSEGSKIYGLTFTGIVFIAVGNIVISKNKIDQINFYSTYGNFSNITISQNYIGYIRSTDNGTIGTGTNTITNVLIKNNFIYKDWGYNYAYGVWPIYEPPAINLQINISGSIINNTIKSYIYTCWANNGVYDLGALRVFGFFICNNIIQQGKIENTTFNLFSNNICNSTQLTATDGNQANVDMSTVFVGSGSTDGQWKLKEGSPAIGAGLGGVDCGMFGGNQPYVLSGMPSIPAVYDIVMPTTVVGNNNLPVTVSAKAH